MSVLIRVLIGNVVGVLTVGLLGCGCLYPFTPQKPNLYADVYKANDLRYSRKYTKSIAEYEQALKKLPRSPTDTKIMNVSFPTFLKYHIAFCYAKLAEANGDISLYVKAEAAAKESYETAVLLPDQADVLYLWGYILFKQGRYAEALSKFEKLIDAAPQSGFRGRFLEEALYACGKTYLELGNATAAGQIFAQLEAIIPKTDGYFQTAGIVCALGKGYLELGDETAARRVFAQLEVLIKMALQGGFVGPDADEVYAEVLYGLGKVYMELGEESTARRMFAMLLEHYSDSPHKAEVERLLEKQ